MKRYGLRIGTTGIEFSSKDERDKALLCFTKGGTVKVNTSDGIRYEEEGDPAFGTYERESNEVLCNCEECKGTFSNETCSKRSYRRIYPWGTPKKTEDYSGWICDGCLAKITKDIEIFEAKQKLQQAGQEVTP